MFKENKRAYSHLNLGRLDTDKRVLSQLVGEPHTHQAKKFIVPQKEKMS